MIPTQENPADDDEPECGVVVRAEVDDLVEPEGEQSPAQARPEQDPLCPEAVAEVATQDLGQAVAPEEGGEDGAHVGLAPLEGQGGRRGHQRERRAGGVDAGRPAEQGEEPNVLFSAAD